MLQIPSDDTIQAAIQEIIDRPEFQPPEESLVQRLLQKLYEAVISLLETAQDMTGVPVLVLLLAMVAVAAVCAYLLRRFFRSRKLKNIPETLPDFGDLWCYEHPWQAVDEFAAKQQYAAALVWLFSAHLRDLQSQNLVVIHKSKTNFQYEQELVQNRFDKLEEFRKFKMLFNAVRYGGSGVTEETFEWWHQYALCYAQRRDAA